MKINATKVGIAVVFIALLPVHWWYITSVCMVHPNAAFLPGIFLFCLSPFAYSCRTTQRIRSTVAVGVMGIAWVGYAFWENKLFRMFDLHDVPIRVDLLVILPFLWFGSGKVVEVFMEELNQKQRSDGQHPPAN